MPGLRGVPLPAAAVRPHVGIGPSLAKVPLDLALAATALRRALGTRYDAVHSHEEGGAIGVVLAALLGVPHLYDMHSSLPQQLANFDFSRRGRWRGAFGADRAAAGPALARRDRDLPAARATSCAAIDPLVPTVLIENAPGAGDRAGRRRAAASLRATLGLEADDAGRALHRHLRGVSGARPAVRRGGARAARRGPTSRFLLAGGQPDQVEAARAQARRAGARRRRRLHRRSARPTRSRSSSTRRRARLAAQPRHEHAAEDLPVPPRRAGRSSRRACSRTRRCSTTTSRFSPSRRRTAFAGGILRALDDPARGRAIGARARAAGRHEVQLRGLPRAHARGAAAGSSRTPRRPGGAGRRVTRAAPRDEPITTATRIYADPAMAEALRRAALQRADRRAARRDAGSASCASSPAPSAGARVLDVGTGTGRAALALAAARRAR